MGLTKRIKLTEDGFEHTFVKWCEVDLKKHNYLCIQLSDIDSYEQLKKQIIGDCFMGELNVKLGVEGSATEYLHNCKGLEEVIEKAKKWDSLDPDTIPYIKNGNILIEEWKEKAEKWDESYCVDQLTILDDKYKTLEQENKQLKKRIDGDCGLLSLIDLHVQEKKELKEEINILNTRLNLKPHKRSYEKLGSFLEIVDELERLCEIEYILGYGEGKSEKTHIADTPTRLLLEKERDRLKSIYRNIKTGLQAHREELDKSQKLYKGLKFDFEDLAREDNEIRQKADKDINRLKAELKEITASCGIWAKESQAFKHKLKKINEITLHAGCMGNPKCVLCPIQKILKEDK